MTGAAPSLVWGDGIKQKLPANPHQGRQELGPELWFRHLLDENKHWLLHACVYVYSKEHTVKA